MIAHLRRLGVCQLGVGLCACGAGVSVSVSVRQRLCQWKLSPQAQEPPALGLSMVKPCFSMESTKSMVAPLR